MYEMINVWIRKSKDEVTQGHGRSQKSLSARYLKNSRRMLTTLGRHVLQLMPVVSRLGCKRSEVKVTQQEVRGQGHVTRGQRSWSHNKRSEVKVTFTQGRK